MVDAFRGRSFPMDPSLAAWLDNKDIHAVEGMVTNEGMNGSGPEFRLQHSQILCPDSMHLSLNFALVSYAFGPLLLHLLLLRKITKCEKNYRCFFIMMQTCPPRRPFLPTLMAEDPEINELSEVE